LLDIVPVARNKVLEKMHDAVFTTLFNNTVQHNDKPVPTVEVSTSLENDTAVVSVAGDGPGISAEQREEIFGRGAKGLDSSETGVGLHLVDKLVGRYGGSVEISDTEPEGTVFTVRLPVASGAPEIAGRRCRRVRESPVLTGSAGDLARLVRRRRPRPHPTDVEQVTCHSRSAAASSPS
jgi:hypothetical protein